MHGSGRLAAGGGASSGNATLTAVLDAGKLGAWFAGLQHNATAAQQSLLQGAGMAAVQQQLLAGLRQMFGSAGVRGTVNATSKTTRSSSSSAKQTGQQRRRRHPGAHRSRPGHPPSSSNETAAAGDSAAQPLPSPPSSSSSSSSSTVGRRLRGHEQLQRRTPWQQAAAGGSKQLLAAAQEPQGAPAGPVGPGVLYRSANSIILQPRPADACAYQFVVLSNPSLLGGQPAAAAAGGVAAPQRGRPSSWLLSAGTAFLAVSFALGAAICFMAAQLWHRYRVSAARG